MNRFDQRRPGWCSWALIAAAGLLIAAGCSRDSTQPIVTTELTTTSVDSSPTQTTETSSPSTTEPTTSTTESVEDAVLAAFEGFNEAFELARHPYDPEYPLLDVYATGALRERLRESFSNSQELGDVAGGEYIVGATTVTFEEGGAVARVVACTHDLTTRSSRAGELLSDPNEKPDLFYSVLRQGPDEQWQVFEEGYVNGTPTECEL